MNKKWIKQSFKGWKPVEFDWTTAKELIHAPVAHMFATKLYVSHYCPRGCLRIQDEEVVQ
jgi:hypothetical protein